MGTVPPALRKRKFTKKGKAGADPEEPGENAKEEASETLAQERAEEKTESAGKTPTTVKGVRDMVAAEKKVAPHKKAAHRAKTIKGARKVGAMGHIPPPWLKKG